MTLAYPQRSLRSTRHNRRHPDSYVANPEAVDDELSYAYERVEGSFRSNRDREFEVLLYASVAESNTEVLPLLSKRVLEAMQESTLDFRTVESLAKELSASSTDVLVALSLLGGRVRRPAGAERLYPNLFRLTSRGLTRRERWWRWRRIAGRTSS